MQGKKNFGLLLKHCLKESWRGVIIGNASFVVGFILLSLFIRVVSGEFLLSRIGTIVIVSMATIVYALLFVGICFVIVSVVKLFYQKLFTDEGYLTFTLPVSIDELLLSRLLTNIIWGAVTTVAFVTGVSLGLFIMGESSVYLMTIDMLTTLTGRDVVIIISYAFSAFVGYVLFLVEILLALALANSVIKENKKTSKGVMAFVFIIIISVIMGIVESVLSLVPFGVAINTNGETIFAFGFKGGVRNVGHH